MYTKIDTLGNYVIPPVAIVYSPYCIYPYEPRIAVDLSNRLHLIWADQRLDSAVVSDIFYKRGENEPGIGELAETYYDVIELSVKPNPFRYFTDIRYQITDTRERCGLMVYDITGRLVTDLSEQMYADGYQLSARWDGTDNHNHPLPAGVYLVHIQSSRVAQSVPVVLLR
jgi:hypothetical protein